MSLEIQHLSQQGAAGLTGMILQRERGEGPTIAIGSGIAMSL